jgi:hypothetical protein
MKIIGRKQFLLLPSGILYRKYEPCITYDFCVKKDVVNEGDFYYTPFDAIDCENLQQRCELFEKYREDGCNFEFDYEIECRDGEFEDDQLFIIYEEKDILQLIDKLTEIKNEYKKTSGYLEMNNIRLKNLLPKT